jgi:Uma2 family endonuclease
MLKRYERPAKAALHDGIDARKRDLPRPEFLMPKALILEPALVRDLIRKRQVRGIDKYDEVWEGVYVMPPLATNPHQSLVFDFCMVANTVVRPNGGRVQPGANVSDREHDWEKNFRVPDVVVVLKGGRAVDCDTHWFGGPDFLMEAKSPGDDTEKKISFYGQIQVRELLVIHRDTRHLRLYRHDGKELVLVGESQRDKNAWLKSEVLPLELRWKSTKDGPRTEVRRTDGKKGRWVI